MAGLGFILTAAAAVSAAAVGELAGAAFTGRWPPISPSILGAILPSLLQHPGAPFRIWPAPWRYTPPALYWAVAVACGAVAPLGIAARWLILSAPRRALLRGGPKYPMARAAVAGPMGAMLGSFGRGSAKIPQATWARAWEIGSLRVRAPCPGRLTLGRVGRALVATEAAHSLIVIGPTQTMKTSGLAIPAILEWEGPILAVSVKGDLLAATDRWRASRGEVGVFDPTGAVGRHSSWSPLAQALPWQGARRVAKDLCDASRQGAPGLQDGDFWYSAACKLLAPLLYAAANAGLAMADVVAWVDSQEESEVDQLLAWLGNDCARRAVQAIWSADDRQRSSVYVTAQVVLEAFAEPLPDSCGEIDTDALVGGRADTIYVCAPGHDQARLRPLFGSLVSEVVHKAYARVDETGRPLEPPLLIVLDEAANIAPVADLDGLAATASSHGIQLVTIWQDLAQLNARYGQRASTVFNNHRAKLILSGISDPATLEQVSLLMGEAAGVASSSTSDGEGRRSTTVSESSRRLMPPDGIRRIRPGEGVLLYGHLPPARLTLRPYFADRVLSARSGGPERHPRISSPPRPRH